MAEAHLRQSLAVVSCERCKHRKSRCDRQLPVCSRCAKTQNPCTYSTRKKPGFSAGYRQNLESKIDRVELALAQLRESRCACIAETDQGGRPVPSSPTALGSMMGTFTHDASALLQAPQVPRFPASSRLVTDRLATDKLVATSERTQSILETQPPPDLLISLTSLFFQHIHPWFPFLDPRRIMSELASAEDDTLLRHALFGVSMPFSYDSRLNRNSSDSYWKYSKRRIMLEILEEPSYNSLEALTILILDLSGMTNGAQVWGVLAIALRLALQLRTAGPHIFRTSTTENLTNGFSVQDKINRHRLFWAIYALDCYISITTCHTTDLMDRHVAHFLPSREWAWQEQRNQSSLNSEENNPEVCTSRGLAALTPQFVFSYQLQLLDLSRRAHALYVEFSSFVEGDPIGEWVDNIGACSTDLITWTDRLPPTLQDNLLQDTRMFAPHILPSVLTLHAYRLALTIHLQGLLICRSFPQRALLSAELQREAHERCLKAVRSLAAFASTVGDKVRSRLGWPFAWSLWIGVRFILVCEYYHDISLPQERTILVNLIRMMGKQWQIAAKYSRLLERACEELQQMAENPDFPAKVLPYLVDLRIPTSDLEDRFRVDPVLHPKDTSQALPHIDGVLVNGGGAVDTNESSYVDNFYAASLYQSDDNWYGIPLFGTSAYQQSESAPVDTVGTFGMFEQGRMQL